MKCHDKIHSIESEIDSILTDIISLRLENPTKVVYSTNQRIMEVQERLDALNKRLRVLKFKLKCVKLEYALPDFRQMTNAEIMAFIDKKSKPSFIVTHLEYFTTKEGNRYLLVREATNKCRLKMNLTYIEITPKIYKYLKSRGF